MGQKIKVKFQVQDIELIRQHLWSNLKLKKTIMLKQLVTGEQIWGIRKVKVKDKNCLSPVCVQLANLKLCNQTVTQARTTSKNVVVIFCSNQLQSQNAVVPKQKIKVKFRAHTKIHYTQNTAI